MGRQHYLAIYLKKIKKKSFSNTNTKNQKKKMSATKLYCMYFYIFSNNIYLMYMKKFK